MGFDLSKLICYAILKRSEKLSMITQCLSEILLCTGEKGLQYHWKLAAIFTRSVQLGGIFKINATRGFVLKHLFGHFRLLTTILLNKLYSLMELFTNLFAERQLQLNSIYDDNTSCIQCLRSDSQNRESLSRMLLTYVFPSNSYFAFLLW